MDTERQRLLESRGYKVRTYERMLPLEPDGDDQRVATWPTAVKSEPRPDGSDYDSFPAVFSPNGTPVRPYQADSKTPMPIDLQWDMAWEQYARKVKALESGKFFKSSLNDDNGKYDPDYKE